MRAAVRQFQFLKPNPMSRIYPTSTRALSLGMLLGFVCSSLLPAEVTVSPLFGNHAVLQRDKPVPIWGTAAPGAKVTVTFAPQTKEAIASSNGEWKVTLDAMPASSEPRELLIRGENESHRSKDVLVGDVWLCAGQSNMNFRVSRSLDGDKEAEGGNFPEIRCLKVPAVPSATPSSVLRSKWDVCTPQTAGGFSAVAYFFARDVHQELKVPVGLITSSWGGTQIETWMNKEALQNDPAYKDILARWEEYRATIPEEMQRHAVRLERLRVAKEKAAAEGVEFTGRAPREPDGEIGRRTPSNLFNGMIHPLAPVAVCGILWYQGESNAGRPGEYRTLFPAMIRQWRATFGQGDIPFYFVQLPNWNRPGDDVAVAYQREAQATALSLPETGMAVTIDVGEPDDVHPKNKQDVGKRLARVALAQTFKKAAPASGPIFSEAKFANDQVRVSFKSTGKLQIKEAEPNGFEMAGADRQFFPAKVQLEEDILVISSPSVPKPVAVRYAFRNAPPSTLTDASNLPAAPFRTDDWPYVPPAKATEVELP